MCTDLVQKGRDLSAQGPPTQPVPRERAEAVREAWRLLCIRAARRRQRLHTSLLVLQVAAQGRSPAGGAWRGRGEAVGEASGRARTRRWTELRAVSGEALWGVASKALAADLPG